jgi:thiosulfate dehydrogenase
MPLGVTYQNTQLSDEEAWDVAAYINSQTRPHKDLSQDWPKIADKPFDHPFDPILTLFQNCNINTVFQSY